MWPKQDQSQHSANWMKAVKVLCMEYWLSKGAKPACSVTGHAVAAHVLIKSVSYPFIVPFSHFCSKMFLTLVVWNNNSLEDKSEIQIQCKTI